MPQLDWSRVGPNPRTARWIPVFWGVLAAGQFAWWASGGARWLLYAAGLWATAALVYVATAAGWLPAGKRKNRPGAGARTGRRR